MYLPALPAFLLVLMPLAAVAQPALAEPAAHTVNLLRDRPPAERPQLLLIGTPHFANYGHDVVNSQVPDVLDPQRQKEIAAVAEALAKFRPTKIVAEWPIDKQAELDARYQHYLAGQYVLTRNETDQLALRLAASLGHRHVYAVDWNKMPPGALTDFDYAQWAQSHGQQAHLAAIRDTTESERNDARMRHSPVAEWLVRRNRPEQLEVANRRYFDYAMLGDSTDSPGANWVANWYGRNLKIFANLVRLADRPDDRILVIYGSGHIFPLSQFARQSGAFTVVDPLPYLTEAASGTPH